MNFLDFVPPVVSNLFTPKKYDNGFFYVVGSSRESAAQVDCLKSYEDISELSAIINMKARTFSNMKVKAIDKNGNEINTPETDRVKALLLNPNWFQGGKEFLVQTKTLREIFGNEFIYSQIPFGFKISPERTKSIYTLPANIVKASYNSSTPFFLNDSKAQVEYKYKEADGLDWKPLPADQVIHLNDNRVSMKSATDKELLNGESKMQSLRLAINNIRLAYESRGVILRNRGANGAWVTKSKDGVGSPLPLEKKEKDELQSALSGYGTLEGQSQDIITNAELAWIQRGTNDPMKLGIFQEIEEDFNKMLDAYGVPSEIFVRTKGATYENQRQAEKGFYVRTIIPEANEWLGAITSELSAVDGITYVADYSHLPVFQEDLKLKSDALNSLITALSKMLSDGAITIEMYQNEIEKYGFKK